MVNMVIAVAGILPVASLLVIVQLTVLLAPCTTVPHDLVTAANRRSVPTAVAGWMPKTRIRSGVIIDPPPTPVCPTSRPTSSPQSEYQRIYGRDETHLAILARPFPTKALPIRVSRAPARPSVLPRAHTPDGTALEAARNRP